jgi:hypothetical protein
VPSISLPRHLGGLHTAGHARLPGAPGRGVRAYGWCPALSNRSALLDLIDRPRCTEPVAAAGVARLFVLLRDGCSPLYTPARPDLLARELDRVHRALAP